MNARVNILPFPIAFSKPAFPPKWLSTLVECWRAEAFDAQAGAYVIFKGSAMCGYGLFVGLFMLWAQF
jgi:hypothetical protein